jgi:diaminohydroxyphosphoribosylaminopyrimidine deaminase/5-amino-6-(5-phosphoribosylamino)uracil reductase
VWLVPPFVSEEVDAQWMRAALSEAASGRGRVEPNPLVGAVIVKDGRSVGTGHHERFGGPHAEVVALERAGEQASGATLYVTLEPCCHFGKTPPCTTAILASGIARVVAAIRDPFAKVNGHGLTLLESAGLAVGSGCEQEAARALNAPYLKRMVTGLPYVTAKWAMTLDGKTAVGTGQSRWISSKSSRQQVHELRGRMDAIVVGIGTVVADDPLLTARPPGPRKATRVVLDSAALLPRSSQLVKTARDWPVLVAVTDSAEPGRCANLRDHGCEVVVFPGGRCVPIVPLLEVLASREMTNVLVEGGGRVLGSFLDENQLDEVDVYIAPIIEGGDHAKTAVRGNGRRAMNEAMRLATTETSRVDGDIRIRGYLPQAWRALAGFTSP